MPNTLYEYLTFIRPCIVIYFYSKTNEMDQCIKFILFWVTLHMFRTVSPSIIRNSRLYIQQQAYGEQILLTACFIIRSSRLYIQQPNRYWCLFARKQTAVSVWHMPVPVCTVLNSWWWTERPSETCRVSFQNKIIWSIGASGWFYYRNFCVNIFKKKYTNPPVGWWGS